VLQGLVPKPSESSPRRSAPTIQPGSVSRRLFEAFLLLFDSLSRKKPLVLFLDDAHWIDETSLAVIQFVRRRAQGNVAIVMVFTTELIRTRPCIESFLESIRRDCHEIVVTGLEAEPAKNLVRSLAKDSIPARELKAICSLGSGNPFYLSKLTAEFNAGRLSLSAEPGEPLIPPSLSKLLEPRVSRLSPKARGMLAALAVSGHKQSLPELVTLLGTSLASVIETTEELLDLRLVLEDSCSYRIAHPLLRRAVYDGLGNARRRTLHESIARVR